MHPVRRQRVWTRISCICGTLQRGPNLGDDDRCLVLLNRRVGWPRDAPEPGSQLQSIRRTWTAMRDRIDLPIDHPKNSSAIDRSGCLLYRKPSIPLTKLRSDHTRQSPASPQLFLCELGKHTAQAPRRSGHSFLAFSTPL